MALIAPQIIAPDTAHWATWIDHALGADPARRAFARGFHGRLLDQGKIAFLSWHHLEELLGIESDENARRRIEFIQSLPLVAWMRQPTEKAGLGAITDILAAEVAAVDQGCATLIEVRDHARERLLQTGPAIDAIGTENWVWGVVRPMLLARRPRVGMVAALAEFSVFDMNQTVAQVVKHERRTPEERNSMLKAIHAKAFRDAMSADPSRTVEEARAFADDLVSRTLDMLPAQEIGVRELIVSTYLGQGLEPHEIRDECRLSDLTALATFRQQLRVAAEITGLPLHRLSRVRMEQMPSWLIMEALRKYGQKRLRRPGSDVHDQHLAVLSAYTDVLYVDKRTHEDFRRVCQKAPELVPLLGSITKAVQFRDMLDAASAF